MRLVPTVEPAPALVPHFRDFLPQWIARQRWFRGDGIPSVAPVGFIRFEDPVGEVGMETHLLTDGSAVYQIPMTYRGAPTDIDGLIATAEHSVLGTRWIYDATADPVWIGEVLRLVAHDGATGVEGGRGLGPAQARGRRLVAGPLPPHEVTIDLVRVLAPGPADERDALGVVTGTWHPAPGASAVTGCLAVVRASASAERRAEG